jgi:hypothetical protein
LKFKDPQNVSVSEIANAVEKEHGVIVDISKAGALEIKRDMTGVSCFSIGEGDELFLEADFVVDTNHAAPLDLARRFKRDMEQVAANYITIGRIDMDAMCSAITRDAYRCWLQLHHNNGVDVFEAGGFPKFGLIFYESSVEIKWREEYGSE